MQSRREFVGRVFLGASTGLLVSQLPTFLMACKPNDFEYQKLTVSYRGYEDQIYLPKPFTARILARSSLPVLENNPSSYVWHKAPDGAAVVPLQNGGWAYVSNSEVWDNKGGAGALYFNSNGDPVDGRSLLQNTNTNCAGGKTPWNTWLSCEEVDNGRVFECFVLEMGAKSAQVASGLGIFKHEAAAFDDRFYKSDGLVSVYLTEDTPLGYLYRYSPKTNLNDGTLYAAQIFDQNTFVAHSKNLVEGTTYAVKWTQVSQNLFTKTNEATYFDGGEGIDVVGDNLFFSTKNDNRIWRLGLGSKENVTDLKSNTLKLFYNPDTSSKIKVSSVVPEKNISPSAFHHLWQVDNLTHYDRSLVVVEDRGKIPAGKENDEAYAGMQISILKQDENGQAKQLFAFAQVLGHKDSEITGPAFSPDGTRLYFSSQRGKTGVADGTDGVTYEISGPFKELLAG